MTNLDTKYDSVLEAVCGWMKSPYTILEHLSYNENDKTSANNVINIKIKADNPVTRTKIMRKLIKLDVRPQMKGDYVLAGACVTNLAASTTPKQVNLMAGLEGTIRKAKGEGLLLLK